MKARLEHTQSAVQYYIENLDSSEADAIALDAYLSQRKKTITEVLQADCDIADSTIGAVLVVNGDLEKNEPLRLLIQCALIVAGALRMLKFRWLVKGEHLAINIANNGLPADAVRLK